MKQRYQVKLTVQERQRLQALSRWSKANARLFLYVRSLLLCDTGPQGPAWTVADTAEAMGVTCRTIDFLKQRYVEEGLNAVLQRRRPTRPPRNVVFDGAFEARLIALAGSGTPEGHRRWSLRLLARKAVEMRLAPSVSHSTVQRILKRSNLSLAHKGRGISHRTALPRSHQTGIPTSQTGGTKRR